MFKDLTVRRNLEVASCCRDTRVLANLGFGFSREGEARVDEVLELVGLTEEAATIAANLSHGQTQWLELGMLMVQNAKVLLLDEPTAGMTQAETLKTSKIINALKGKHTLLVVEHDMAFVREIAQRITVMHLGQVLAEGNVTEIEKNPESPRSLSRIEGDQLMLKLVEVDSFYGRSHVLHGVNLDVPAGEITTILGRNGTGKTTLLKTIMGLTDRSDRRNQIRKPRYLPASRRSGGRAPALPMCRKAARSFPTSRSARTSCSAPTPDPTAGARSRALCPSCSPI